MRPQPAKKRQFHKERRIRLSVYVCCAVVGIALLVGITFAWYSQQKREAETNTANVMKPYYLTLKPSGTDAQQLSIGSLLQGSTKQIVFCVSSDEEPQINKGTTTFEYALELVHTDNMALKYEIYPLEETAEGESSIIVAEDIVKDSGEVDTRTTYWKKKTVGGVSKPLTGVDVSAERWVQAGLTGTEGANAAGTDGASEGTSGETGQAAGMTDAALENIINRGTYISYAKSAGNEDGTGVIDNGLVLEVGEGAVNNAQYFVLEVSWSITSGFEKYDKETDMIYLLAKALQPEPEAVAAAQGGE